MQDLVLCCPGERERVALKTLYYVVDFDALILSNINKEVQNILLFNIFHYLV